MELEHQLLLLEEDLSLGVVAIPQTLISALQGYVVGKAGGDLHSAPSRSLTYPYLVPHAETILPGIVFE